MQGFIEQLGQLKIDKCSVEQMNEHVAQITSTFEAVDNQIEKIKQDCSRIESYLDRYLNIRIQNIISTTLGASLTG